MVSLVYSSGVLGIDGFEVAVECSAWDRIPRLSGQSCFYYTILLLFLQCTILTYMQNEHMKNPYIFYFLFKSKICKERSDFPLSGKDFIDRLNRLI